MDILAITTSGRQVIMLWQLLAIYKAINKEAYGVHSNSFNKLLMTDVVRSSHMSPDVGQLLATNTL